MRSRLRTLLAILLVAGLPASVDATVFRSRSEALDLAFPDADHIDSETYVLTERQVERIEQLSRSPMDSKLVKIYTGWKGDAILGYAFIDIHTVRTLPQALMVVLTPEGEVRSIRLLAFYEPLEYRPTRRWYDQFEHKSLEQPLRVGGDIHGVVGATLSARATTSGVRRALALYEVVAEDGK